MLATLALHTAQVLLGRDALLRVKDLVEALPDSRQRHPVLRPLGPGQARLDGGQVELEQLAEHRRLHPVHPEQTLRLAVALDEVEVAELATGHLQVAERLVVDREQGRGGAVLRAHVGEGRPVGHRE